MTAEIIQVLNLNNDHTFNGCFPFLVIILMNLLFVQQPPSGKLSRKTPLEDLFAEEEAENMVSQQSSMSIKKRVAKELQMYQEMPPAVMSEDPAAGWWNQRKTYPLLSDLAF